MGLKGNLLALVCLLISVIICYKIKKVFEHPEKPQIDDIWWGVGDISQKNSNIRPFKINISDDILEDLQYRLTNHIPFQPNLEDVVESYGMNAELLNSIVEFWKNKYNWREREIFLNQFPHYMVNIQGLDIHYIHVKPKKTKGIKVLPLLISHGWPGSVREFYDIIPMLTTPQKDKKFVFEVIAPSIPGYGFSEAPNRPGLHIFHIANIFKNLMKKIGFEKFYVQGGDWGGAITQTMAAMYPEHVIGMHSNWCLILSPLQFTKTMIGGYFPSLIGIPKEQEKYLYPQSEKISMLILESGYFHLQATKPDTVGVALRDSPVGLAAYMLEKFIRKGSKHWEELYDGVSPKKYTDLLDNVMIYWVTRSMTTSMRLYAEYMTSSKLGLNRIPVEVPSGCARFTRELTFHPDVILKDRYLNLVHVADYEGGHFAALELPKILAKDIFTFVEKVENLKTL